LDRPENKLAGKTRMKSESTAFLLSFVLIGSTLAASKLADRGEPELLQIPLESISSSLAGWEAVSELPLSQRALDRLRPTEILSRVYRRNARRLQLFIAYYAQQRAGEAMHSPKQCLPGAGWEIWKYGSLVTPWNGSGVKINKYGVQKGTTRMLVFYWYQSGSSVIASEYQGKVLLVRDALFTGRTSGALVRFAIPDEPGAEQDGAMFAAALMGELERCFWRENP
jgi:EpsI family protein